MTHTTTTDTPWPHPSPLLDALGGFVQVGGDPCTAGFLVEGAKLNARGFLHAGTIAAVADVAIGHALAALTDPPGRAVTVNLSCDLIGSARLGEWVELQVEPTKRGRRLCAGTATVTAGERGGERRRIGTVTALFVPV